MNSPADSNQKLYRLLTYLLSPIMPIIVLVSDSMKKDPVLKKDAVQSLAYAVVAFVISIILTVTVILACLAPVLFIPTIIWAIQSYQGKDINIPVITDFCKKQNWF
ncbi:MAG TPA: hypothetical protein PLG23_09995 [Thermoflexales bacterium]|jgi:uncharacterized membrane protein|nr:hypothetical protein [Thermoflexales bacterium]HQX11015.1 hypothetical protein [Thermoflexales bacterium]HQY24763.1 hypothetical protein [Thermoflexales bacterium]HQZ53785.1 hypothetical protein [Thermoflexales bacterium]HRA55745.1 hypothetical protein [Thermoflexales bacterium]